MKIKIVIIMTFLSVVPLCLVVGSLYMFSHSPFTTLKENYLLAYQQKSKRAS
jgi:hypothetical protein